jgi:hypothetical protein
MKQAAGISDETLRRSFLENVKTNRAIVSAWESGAVNGRQGGVIDSGMGF